MRDEVFLVWWANASERVRVVLRKDYTSDEIDDLVQATAVKALAEGAFDSESHLIKWSVRVAKNLGTDEFRKRSRELLVGQPEPTTHRAAIDDEVIVGLAADLIEAEIAKLSDYQRKVLFEGSAGFPGISTSVRAKIDKQRSRLRAYFRKLIAGVLGGFGRFRARFPFGDSAEAASLTNTAAAAAAVVLAVVAVATSSAWEPNNKSAPVPAPPRSAVPAGANAVVGDPLAAIPLAEIGTGGRGASRVAPTSASFSIPLWKDKDGNRESIDYGPGKPEEQGDLLCGVETAVGPVCIRYPERVMEVARWSRLGELLP